MLRLTHSARLVKLAHCLKGGILIASRAKTNRNRIVCISNSTSATTWGTAYLSRRLANIGDPRLHVHETASRSMSSPAIAQSRAITSGRTVFGYERVYPLCPQFGEVAVGSRQGEGGHYDS